ncbi:MAG: hypothetical protein JRN45_00340 [Nitrososphaerota archaeon]|nr:hypothetical protein [Nitrososphaerota archaeon]
MVRILWFKEASRWTRRGIPLKVVWVSPRQLSILAASLLVGVALSAPLPTPTLKLVVIGPLLLAGLAAAFWRVKMLTPEQLVLMRLRGLTAVSQSRKRPGKAPAPAAGPEAEERSFQIEADDAESFTPLSISGRWKRTKLPRKVSLYVDGVPRAGAEALATPVSDTESGYTIVFLPTAADIGTRDLEVKAEGEERPIYKVKIDVKVKGTRSLEMKKVSS